jgi:hypothetical protein
VGVRVDDEEAVVHGAGSSRAPEACATRAGVAGRRRRAVRRRPPG